MKVEDMKMVAIPFTATIEGHRHILVPADFSASQIKEELARRETLVPGHTIQVESDKDYGVKNTISNDENLVVTVEKITSDVQYSDAIVDSSTLVNLEVEEHPDFENDEVEVEDESDGDGEANEPLRS